MAEIDEVFCQPGYYDETPPEEVSELEGERVALQERVAQLLEEWEYVAGELEE
jgi:hypothetical protein